MIVLLILQVFLLSLQHLVTPRTHERLVTRLDVLLLSLDFGLTVPELNDLVVLSGRDNVAIDGGIYLEIKDEYKKESIAFIPEGFKIIIDEVCLKTIQI